MKRLFLLYILTFALGIGSYSQNCDIHLMAINADQDDRIPTSSQEYLFNKLCTAISGNGISASSNYAQFFVAARALPLYEQIVQGPPSQIALTLSLNLYIGDIFGEKIFNRISFEIRGVGESKERAFLNAIRMLNKNNTRIAEFLNNGKKHILNYYDTEYTNILKEAKRAAQLRNYPRALFLLCAVPTCSSGYNAVSAELTAIYKEYINYNCDRLLMQARNAWAVSPDQQGAQEVAAILNQLEPDASCYGEAMSLYKEVKSKLKDDWDFEMRQKYKDAVSINKQIIEAARAVGVAYGKGQQPKTTNIIW